MDAFGVLGEVLCDYESFVSGFLDIRDDRVRQKVEKEIEEGLLWPEPWLALNPAFESGGTVAELVDRDVLHPATREFSGSAPRTTRSAGKSPSTATRPTRLRSPTVASPTC